MRTFRDYFEENYMAYEEPCGNKRGFRIKYEYVGPWYGYQLSPEAQQKYKKLFGVLCAGSTILYAAAALRKCTMNNESFVILFTGFSMAAFVFLWFGIVKFLTAGEKMTDENFKEIHTILRIVPYLNGILLLGAAVFSLRDAVQSRSFSEIWTISLVYLCSGITSGAIGVLYHGLPFERRKNRAKEDPSKKYIRV